jgi:hypothetical protein
MNKTLWLILTGALLASCSKSGSDSQPPPPAPIPVVVAVVPSYSQACVNAGYGPGPGGGYGAGYQQQPGGYGSGYPNEPQYFPGSPYYGNELSSLNCPMNTPNGYANGQNFAGVPIRDLRRGYWNNSSGGIYFRLSLGVSFNGGSYWPMSGGLPGSYYGSPYFCSQQQTRDFYETVALPCGYKGGPYQDGFYVGDTYDGFQWMGNSFSGQYGGNYGYTTDHTMLYSTTCKNRFIDFKTRNPDIFCSFSFGGIFGILDERYLIHNICTLNQCGL